MIALVIAAAGCTKEELPTLIPVTTCSAEFSVIGEPAPGKCNHQGERLSCTGISGVEFIGKSGGKVTAWARDFNNDSVIDSSNGNYTITLTIVTPDCQGELTKQDYVNIGGWHT